MKISTPGHQADLDNEIRVFHHLPPHPNIVTYIKAFVQAPCESPSSHCPGTSK